MPPKKSPSPDLWIQDLKRMLVEREDGTRCGDSDWEEVVKGLPYENEAVGVSSDDCDDLLPEEIGFSAERLVPYVQKPVELFASDAPILARPRKAVFRIVWQPHWSDDVKTPDRLFGIDCALGIELSPPLPASAQHTRILDPETGAIVATLGRHKNILWVYAQPIHLQNSAFRLNRYREIFDALITRVILLLPAPALSPEQWVRERAQARRAVLDRTYKAYRVHLEWEKVALASETLIASLDRTDEAVSITDDIEHLACEVAAYKKLIEQFREKTAAEFEKILMRPDVLSARLWGSVLVLDTLKAGSVWTIVINRNKASDPIRWFKHVEGGRQAYAPSYYRMLLPLVELLSKGAWETLLNAAIQSIGTKRIQPLNPPTGEPT
ncbi:hypothetical protein HY631_04290 [Candidatus Uhrbacteria bacterium]|nr:hypothetical protein [Candidatus Uhrbacteria bacterium]